MRFQENYFRLVQNYLILGLDIIGLYRLCGSETKKKMLRETFEANPEAVDLSSENVPDINVITSNTYSILSKN